MDPRSIGDAATGLAWQAGGARIVGHKVGLTSAVMRRQLGVDQPDYGHLLDGMAYMDGAPIDAARFLQPRVEPEIAFALKRPPAGPGVTAATAAAAVDFVLPALEIIDSRIADWKITLADTIADNASSGGFVLGNRPTPLAVSSRSQATPPTGKQPAAATSTRPAARNARGSVRP
ncbi:2-keto-4-pentenoate hydratase [Nonomuraea angiospora]|uniref:2-keto-4-pentenoate hydratase n=1 Tax=Nonomuraea angiospora TaxID=46172 RepID=UPI0029B81D96|nr:hypothetical protein [Nonomuraea angiospora]MDX3102634.1 hypothetical protein [Nonomuraea angiospora]